VPNRQVTGWVARNKRGTQYMIARHGFENGT